MKKIIKIRLSEALLKELDDYAKELESSRSYLIEKAISAYCDRLDEIIADKRIDEIRNGKTKLYDLEEVTKKLDLG